MKQLVDCSHDLVAAQGCDDTLDLAPVAEAGDIPAVPAALGARRGLEGSVVAKAFDEVRGVGERDPAMNEERVHRTALTSASVERLPTSIVNAAFTIFSLGETRRTWHAPPMQSSTRAGGCFLTICILFGFPLGLSIGNPMKGILIGTGLGIALAMLTWAIDRRRR